MSTNLRRGLFLGAERLHLAHAYMPRANLDGHPVTDYLGESLAKTTNTRGEGRPLSLKKSIYNQEQCVGVVKKPRQDPAQHYRRLMHESDRGVRTSVRLP